jgi:hypothetical protein
MHTHLPCLHNQYLHFSCGGNLLLKADLSGIFLIPGDQRHPVFIDGTCMQVGNLLKSCHLEDHKGDKHDI